MDAKKARALAEKNLKGPVIEPILKHIHAKIEDAARAGRFSLAHPLHGIKDYPNHEAQMAVWRALATEGYEVVHHPDPDPGHPCSMPYDEIKW